MDLAARSFAALLLLAAPFNGDLALAQGQSASDDTLVVALPNQPGDGSCRPVEEIAESGPSAYAEHLQSRFTERVKICLGGAPMDVARDLQSRTVHMAWLDQAAFAVVARTTRALLTPRAHQIGRVPATVFRLEGGAGGRGPDDVQSLGYVSMEPHRLNRDLVFDTLHGWGVDPGVTDEAQPFADFEALVAGLRAGDVSTGATDIGLFEWRCTVLDPANPPCADLETITTRRPAAEEAFVVSQSMDDEIRLRLVGVHVGLHLEAPDAFAWLTGGNALEFSPAEATALDPLGSEY